MRILITGGAGFIGSALARRLINSGHSVVIVDNLSTGKRSNIPPEADFVELDLSRPDFLTELPSGKFDAVCHLAAQSSGAISAEKPLYDLQANAASTLLLSRWCVEKTVPRFLFASSMLIYGNPSVLPVTEDAPQVPISYYGISKMTSENFLRLASREGLSVTSFRMFNVYGAGQDLGNVRQGMVSIYLAYMLRGVPVPVTGSLERFRDFVYIDDAIDAWESALCMTATPSLSYNMGIGRPTTVRKLLALLIQAMELPIDYPILELVGSPSDQFGLYADISRLQKELNWQPRIDIGEGIYQMVKWARTEMEFKK